MTDKELKRLNRSELLEILLDQAQEIEQLKSEIDGYKEKLEDRTILIEESGSLAEASVKLTNVFTEAQKAADLYMENAKRIWEEKETKAANYEKEHCAAADTYEKEHKALYPTPAQYKGEYEWLREADSLALANVQLQLKKAFQKIYIYQLNQVQLVVYQ